jgi:aminopeptidase N
MVRLDMTNSRMKDFFDIRSLAATRSFDGDARRLALAATFQRRQTPLPSELPLALTDEFAGNPQERQQWNAFVRRIPGAGLWT